MNGKEVSRSYDGPADPHDRFKALLNRWKDGENELAECNDLRIAFQLGREQGHLECQYGDDYEANKPQ